MAKLRKIHPVIKKGFRPASKLSKANLIVVAAVFGVVGAYLLWTAFGADFNLSKGDINKDGYVNQADLDALLARYGQADPTADTNDDGQVTGLDLSSLLTNYGTQITPPPPPSATDPSIPTNLHTTSVSHTALNIAWTASTASAGIKQYNIYRNGTLLTNTTYLTYTDSNLSPSTSYVYSISAEDTSGNKSAQSDALNVLTVPNGPDPGPTDDNPLNVRTYHFSAYQKAHLGWLNPSNGVEYIQTVRPGQTIYHIAQSETMGNTNYPKLVRWPHRVTTTPQSLDFIYLEFRQSFGFDTYLHTEATTGVSVRYAYGLKVTNKPYLIDMHPNTTPNYDDAPLQLGESWTDVKSGVTVKVIGIVPGEYATVQITGQKDPPSNIYCGSTCDY